MFLADPANRLVYTVQAGVLLAVPYGVGVVGDVAQGGREANLREAAKDPRWDGRQVDAVNGKFRTRGVLAVPMLRTGGGLVGVVQLVNKKRQPGAVKGSRASFSPADSRRLKRLLPALAEIVARGGVLEELQLQHRRNLLGEAAAGVPGQ